MTTVPTRRRLLAGGALSLAVLAGCSSGDGDGERIRAYDVRVQVDRDGSVAVTETIDYSFADEERHGIVRDIPQRLPYAQEQDRFTEVTDVQVESPTGAPVDLETETDGGALVLRIGDEDEEVTGDHTYVLSYRVDAVATSDGGAGGADRVEWDAVGTGWEVPVDDVQVQLTAPAEPTSGECLVGDEGSRQACDAEVEGSTLEATAAGLEEEQGVTVTALLPAGSVATEPVLRDSFSPARAFGAGPAQIAVALLVLLGLLAPVVVRLRRGRAATAAVTSSARRMATRRSGPGTRVPEPPENARPAQLGTLHDGVADLHEVAATIIDLASRGLLTLREADVDAAGKSVERDADAPPGNWLVVRGAAERPDDLRPYEVELLDVLFSEGDEVLMSEVHAKRRAGLGRVRAAMHRDVVELRWFTADPAAVRRRGYAVATAQLVGGAVLTVLLALWTTFALAGLAVVLAGLLLLGVTHRLPVRTPAGARLLEATRRYREALEAATPDSGVIEAHLAYAVALRVVTAWEDDLASSDVALPTWYAGSPGHGGAWPGVFLLSSSAGSPASTSTSSSGSVGGGAGGGGGGSW